jgi:hypothetical protein
MLPILKVIPVVSTLIDMGKSLYDWWDDKEEKPVTVVPAQGKLTRTYDMNELNPDQTATVVSVFNLKGDTQMEKTRRLNEMFGFSKSTTSYRKVWIANRG